MPMQYDRELLPDEVPWRERFKFLVAKGYMLPFRYRVGWKPSWGVNETPSMLKHEDANIGFSGKVGLSFLARNFAIHHLSEKRTHASYPNIQQTTCHSQASAD
jgi:hypothetical protein